MQYYLRQGVFVRGLIFLADRLRCLKVARVNSETTFRIPKFCIQRSNASNVPMKNSFLRTIRRLQHPTCEEL
jgi:hypothetical protein